MEKIFLSLFLSFLLAFIALYKKALTRPALILAWAFSIVITYSGGICSFLILTMTFIGSLLANKFFKHEKIEIEKNIHKKTNKKDFVQILCNVGIGTLSLVFYIFTKNEIFLISYASVMASSLADSMASELGVLTNKKPIDILSFKRTEKGLSGSVSLLGILASLFGSLIIALIHFLFNFNLYHFFLITIMGVFGSFIDSVYGSLFQVKYKCVKCKIITEKSFHCDNQTVLYKGISFIDNDTVNLLNNISVFILCLLIKTIN